MILTTYNSESLYLFPYHPDWGAGISATLFMPSMISIGRSNRQARAPKGETLRIEAFKFTVDLIQGEPIELKNALLNKTTERVAVPFWPAARKQSDYASTPIPGGLKISYETDAKGWPDFTTFEIHAGRSPSVGYTITANTYTAPLLIGHFAQELEPRLLTDEALTLKVEFNESSETDYALEIDAQTFTDGPTVQGTTPKLFPLVHDFSQAATAGSSTIILDRETIGQGRQLRTEHDGAAASRFLRFAFFTRGLSEVAQLIRFFADQRGAVGTFWLPSNLSETRLQSDVAQSATALQVADASLFNGHNQLALITRDGVTPVAIDSLDGNTINLASSVGPFTARETNVCSLLLCRFSKRRIKLSWTSSDVVETAIEFEDLPPEYISNAGETVGTTIGQLATRGSLYTFTDGTTTWRYTSYERDLTYDGNTYTAANITHGRVSKDIELNASVEIEADALEVVPLLKKWRKELGTLEVQIRIVSINGSTATNRKVAFNGEVQSGTRLQGGKIVPKGGPWQALSGLAPHAEFVPVCEVPLFSAPCGLLKSDWTFNAVFRNVGTAGYPFTFTIDTITRANGGSLPSGFGFLNWFAWGYVILPDGDKVKIKSSTALLGGEISITLARDPATFPAVDDTLQLVPACDGQAKTCKAFHAVDNPEGKYNNYNNWMGAWVAPGNLSLLKVNLPGDNSGGKK